jgi:hypothetical protein
MGTWELTEYVQKHQPAISMFYHEAMPIDPYDCFIEGYMIVEWLPEPARVEV